MGIETNGARNTSSFLIRRFSARNLLSDPDIGTVEVLIPAHEGACREKGVFRNLCPRVKDLFHAL